MTAMTEISPRETLTAMIAKDAGEEFAQDVVAKLDDEQVEATITSFRKADEEKDALRDRLRANAMLRKAVCPADDWKSAGDRYDVARRAVRLIERVAEQEDADVDAIAAALVADNGTIADCIALHGDDPRHVMWGSDFYAFRWRLADAVKVANADKIAAERKRQREAQDAKWAKRGLTRCERCDGQGGRKEWPGFDCFDCGGQGAVEAKH